MVGSDGGDTPIDERLSERLAVLGALDGGVALDERSLLLIVEMREPKVGYDGLGRYLGQWACGLIACGFKQLELLFGTDVGHMEARTKLARQVDGERRALVTSLLGAYERVQHDGWVVAIGLFHALHVLVDERRILTMRHHGQAQGGTGLEHLDERPELIHQHASRGGAHKQLDAWQPGLVEFGVIGHVIARGAIVESVVDVAFLVPAPHLVVPRPLRGGLRNGVGHIEERRHTAIGGRPRLTLDVGLVGQSGLTEVHMTVDHAGQHKTPRGIQSVVEDATGCFLSFHDLHDAVVLNDYGAFEYLAFVDDLASTNDSSHCYMGLCEPFGAIGPRRF